MSELGTITLSRGEFARLAAEHTNTMAAEMEAETPRVMELREQISSLAAEAEAKNIKVDDLTISENPEAADLRRRLDEIVPEFQELAARQEARALRSRQARNALEQAARTDADITLSTSDALQMLGLHPSQLSH